MTGQVDVYYATVTPQGSANLLPLLSDAERDRMARFHFERDRRAYAMAHGLLRQVLGRYLATPYPGDFVVGPQGKPALPFEGPHFNLSHAHGMVAVAVSPSTPVGIDVEDLTRSVDARALAASVLSADETSELEASGWGSEDFLTRWVMKEALAKATGQGLRADFRAISLAGKLLRIMQLPPGFGPEANWSTETRVTQGHIICGAAAMPGAIWNWVDC